MLINEITTSGAIPSLELTVRFAAARQKLIAHNVANYDTPDFRQTDADPARFQGALSRAIDERRKATGSEHGDLRLRRTREVRQTASGDLVLTPRTPSGNILAHDRNNSDIERLMQANAENVAVYRTATDLLRFRYDLLRTAISERV